VKDINLPQSNLHFIQSYLSNQVIAVKYCLKELMRKDLPILQLWQKIKE
jgi:hypothetical protein